MQKTVFLLALTAMAGLAQPAAAALVAHYTFDGNALDSSGNGNDGTVSGAALTTDRFGNTNGAYAFNGSSDWIERASPTHLNIGSQSWTVSAWVNTRGVANNSQVIAGRYECGWNCSPGGSANAALYALSLENNTPTWTIRGDSDTLYSIGAVSGISTGDWHLVTYPTGLPRRTHDSQASAAGNAVHTIPAGRQARPMRP